MAQKKTSHYFSQHHNSPENLRKIFTSLRNHSLSLQTAPNVFSPDGVDKGTEILVNHIFFPPLKSTLRILDLGAGYGPITVWLSKELQLQKVMHPKGEFSFKIYASEINERAAWLLNRNILANNCPKVEVLTGPFQSHVDSLLENKIFFDAIYCNPPLKTGHENMLELFDMAAQLLKPQGFIEYVHKKKLGASGFQAKLQNLRPSWYLETIRKQSGYHIILFSPTIVDHPFKKVAGSGYF